MNKKLRSFHKLFFIVFFSFLFSSLVVRGNTPDLPEKIAPELERIESLPRRTKPAELNIEVTKINSEPLEEVYIDRKNKNIYVDFSKKREQALRGVKNAEDLEKKYNLIVSEDVQGSSEVNGRSKGRNRSASQIMNYEVTEYEGKKVLKIPYENEPQKLYISIQENNQVIKVYNANIERAFLADEKAVIETKTVTINLKNGIKTYEGKTLAFNLEGGLINSEIPQNEVEIIKNGGFINTFSEETTITISYINTNGNALTTISDKKFLNQPKDMQIYFHDPNHEGFAFMYNADGSLKLRLQQINSTGSRSYTFRITHTSGNQTKEHTLIINSQSLQPIKRREATVTYLKGYDNVQSDFDTKGLPNRSVLGITLQSLNGEFVTGKGGETYITAQQIDVAGNPIGIAVSAGRTSIDDFAILDMPDVKITFLRNAGELRLNMKTLDNTKSYRYKLIHRDSNSSNGNVIMEDILNINNEFIEKAEVTLKYKNNYIYDWYKFDLNGNITFGDSNNLTVEKITGNFIKTMPFVSNLQVPRILATEENTGKSVELTYQEGILKGVLKFDNEMDICLVFSPDGHFEFNVGGKLVPKSKYKIRLEHKDSNNKLFKEQILNIQEYDMKNIIEKKEVTISYINGYQTWLGFDKNGNIIEGEAEVKKHNFQDGFIEGFRYYCDGNHSHDKNILKISSPSIETVNYDLRTDNGLYLDATIKTIDGAIIVLRYYCNPNPEEAVLHLYMSQLPETGNRYRFYITHTNNAGDIKEHILNIGDLYEKEEKEVSLYLTGATNNNIIFDENGAILNSNDNPAIIVKKHNFSEGFITSFKQDNCSNIHSTIKIDGVNISNIYDMGHQDSDSIYGAYRRLDIQINNNIYDAFSLFFFCNGKNIGIFYPKIISDKVNRIYITHTQRNKVKEHILNIYPASTKISRISNLKSYEIEDSESLETNPINNVNFGSLEMKINNNSSFPSLALGNQSGDNGWEFYSSIPLSPRKKVEARFESQYQVPVKVQMFFENKNENLNIVQRQDESEKLPTFIGKIKENEKSILADLKGRLIVDNNFKDILNEFRQGVESEIILSPKDLEQVSFVIGSETNGTYKAPNMNSIDIPIVGEKYPNIVIKKPSLENENILLDLNDNMLNKSIQFRENMESSSDFIIKSDSNKFFKSLWYKSTFTLNDSIYRTLENTGNSIPFDIELVDLLSGNKLLLEIQYVDRFPRIKIKSGSEKGRYILNINHYNYGGINNVNTRFAKDKRKSFKLEINYFTSEDNNNFKINKDINDIIIRKENESFIVEYPNNKVSIIQQTKDSTVFPVIALNSKEKWQMNTTLPFNPIDKRPWSSFDIGENIKVSTSLRETPYQNIKKFFIYNKGELSNRNIAVGGYNDKELEGDKNKVEIDFKIDFSQEILEKFWVYSQRFSENKVLIPYSSTDDEINKIYAIKGERDINGFKINSLNILEEIDFPKVYVLKNNDIKENATTVTFKNPVPKSDLNLKGTFDINSNGLKLPNNMPYTLEHPESLNISGVTQEWQGYSKINEYHKIDIKVLRDGVTNFIKTITTDSDGTLKDEIRISNDDKYSYVLKKGKNSLVAIGLETWDLNKTTQYEETLILEHKNSSGRVTHRDKYNVNIEPFNIFAYLAQPNPASADKKLIRSIETGTQRVPLIDFQLKNYDKEITKSTNDNIGVKITIPNQKITLFSSTSTIEGNLSFVGDKFSLQNSNEIGSLVFNVTSGTIEAGKTYSYSYNGRNPLVTITTPKLTENIIEKLEIIGTNIGADLHFPYFNAKSNLKEIIINDNVNIENIGLDLSMGKVSLQQNGSVPNQGSNMHVFPAIALGKRKNLGWEVQGESVSNTNKREIVFTKYSFEKNPTLEISFRTFISEYTNSSNTHSYQKSDKGNKIIIVGSYKWGDLQEKIESEIKLTLSKVMLEKAREISGNRIILKANTDVDNKIALIHSQKSSFIANNGNVYLPTNNSEVSANDRVRYFNYKDIIIEKDSFTKNLALNFLKTYINDTKIVLKKDSITTPNGIETTIYEPGVLYGLNFENTIKIVSSDETVLLNATEYKTDASGNITTPIEIRMTKNGAEATLNISYDNNLNALLSLKDIIGQETFNISLKHIEASGDTRRKYNIALKTNSEDKDSFKEGEVDLVISSRYNSFGGMGILLKEGEIVYPKEVLDLNLINGDFPYKPTQSVENIYLETHEGEFKLIDVLRKILTNGTQIDITKYKNGDILINPFYWRENNQRDSFNLIYKNSNNEILEKYKFNVKTPNFFVASSGILNFGKIYKMGNPKDVIGEADIELYYNDGNIRATYSLDIDKGIPKSGSLYLDDFNNLLVREFILGEENIDSNDSRKRNIKLTGVIDGESIKNTPPGQYEKTLQLLIHIK